MTSTFTVRVPAGSLASDGIAVVPIGDPGPTPTVVVREGGEPVPAQVERSGADATVVFAVPGAVDADRIFEVRLGDEAPGVGIASKQIDDYEGQRSLEVATENGRYVYHLEGGGFASLFDPQDLDWISYHPGGESAGEFRGIPNAVNPEGYFHPGTPGGSTEIVADGPARVVLRSQFGPEWITSWEITSRRATLTFERMGKSFWFLYEGTPGGQIDEAGDRILRSPGIETTGGQSWVDRIPEPSWIAFGSPRSESRLVIFRHEADGVTDSYWPMRSEMTVFGFGREDLDATLTRTPSRFTIALAPADADPAQVVEQWARPFSVELRPEAVGA